MIFIPQRYPQLRLHLTPFTAMAFASLTLVLLLIPIVSLAAVDLDSVALDNLTPNLSPILGLDNTMTLFHDTSDDTKTSFNIFNDSPLPDSDANSKSPTPPDANDSLLPAHDAGLPPLAADTMTVTKDVLTPDMTVGSANWAGDFDPDNMQIPDGANAECITDTQIARRRARRGCITIPVPNAQQSSRENARSRPKIRIKKKPSAKSTQYLDNSPAHQPGLHYNEAEPVLWLCNELKYPDMTIPMCHSADPKVSTDIKWILQGALRWANLYHAYPWIANLKCGELEAIWCCKSVIISMPGLDLNHGLNSYALDYTAFHCDLYSDTANQD